MREHHPHKRQPARVLFLADLLWNVPTGLEGGVSAYTVQQWDADAGSWSNLETLDGSTTSMVIEGDSFLDGRGGVSGFGHGCQWLRVDFERRLLTFEYPDAPDDPIMRRVSVLDDERVELLLTTDANAEETSIYQFQRWDPIDSVWVNLPTAHPANGAFNEVSDVDINLSTDRQTYTYRAVVFNECGEVITQSQEATTMLLQGFSNPEESVFENNLVWTAYEGFAGGIDRYEVYPQNDA